jgi:uncharacterized OB-fold protein
MSESPHAFIADHLVAYDYKRSVGAVLGRFFTELQKGKVLGSKTADGRVLVPPVEADPENGNGLGLEALVEVGPGGAVTSWCWVHEPRQAHPLSRPFAFALVQLDGATSGLVHAVDAGQEDAMKTGMRVVPRFRGEPSGGILDIECFVPEEGA